MYVRESMQVRVCMCTKRPCGISPDAACMLIPVQDKHMSSYVQAMKHMHESEALITMDESTPPF